MPQLNPINFLSQIIIAFLSLTWILIKLSKFVLPLILRIFITRNSITKL